MGILSTVKNRALCRYFINQLSESDFPRYRETNYYKGLYKVDLFNSKNLAGNMNEDVYSGISSCKYEATLIALSEFFERSAVQYSGVGYSNGCAAHPIYFSKQSSINIAKRRALNESVERFSLYNWFLDYSVSHSWLCIPSSLYEISDFIQNKRSIGQFKIAIQFSGYLIISYIELQNGLIFGSALDDNLFTARVRSQSELLRNSLSYRNSLNRMSMSRCDEEIFKVATEGKSFVDRIFNPGSMSLNVPRPRETYELNHKSREKIVVVRSIIDDTIYSKKTLCDNN